MKTLVKIICLLLLIPSIIFANGLNGKFKKTKTIKKEFSVNSDALLELKNKYGSISIESWNQDKVSLEIIITTSSNKESKAIERLNNITIEFSNSNSHVSAKTKIGKRSNWSLFGNNSSSSMDIKYIVKMPISNNLSVNMDYGDVMINKLEGNVDINIDYGKLIAGELLSNSNKINLDYSRGSSIETMGNGYINIDYSSIEVSNAATIDLNSDYSNTTFGNVKDLTFNSDYGSIVINNANNIEGNSDYASLKFGIITNSLIIKAGYGSLKIKEMGENFSEVKLDLGYTGVKMGVNNNSSFSYIIDNKYGGITLPDNVNITKEISKNTSKHFEGNFNGSKGHVSILSKYGSIKITANQ